ncbi:hypothetical protein HRbin36_01854 [bacterium HR36]|nr:hypothetical protein HRbin36_01854 [bacterium HR36]
MRAAPVEYVSELLHYLEQEEARLTELSEELAHLHRALASGQIALANGALAGLWQQLGAASSLQKQRQRLQARLPRRSDGGVDWARIEALLGAESAEAVRRQRARLRSLAQQVRGQLHRLAVMAWFGQELYGRILAAILGDRATSGRYSPPGQEGEPGGTHIIEMLG